MTSDRNAEAADDADWTPEGVPLGFTTGLSMALRDQADRFEPSNDAYRRLAEAVNDRRRPMAGRWVRPVVAAAAVMAAVGLTVALLAGQRTQRVGTGPAAEDVVGDGQLAPPEGRAGGSDQAGTDPGVGEAGEDDGLGGGTGESDLDRRAGQDQDRSTTTGGGPVYIDGEPTGPVRSTELAAARAFLDLLRLQYGATEPIDDGRVVVRNLVDGQDIDGGDAPIAATLHLTRVDGGYAVFAASSEGITIDEVAGGPLPDGLLRIDGSDAGSGLPVGVRVMSALDNRVLAVGQAGAVTPSLPAESDEPTPFTAELAVVGAENAWVIVFDGGADPGATEAFAARSVSYRSVDDPAGYAVVRVRPNDPDDGLQLRSGPGSTEPSLGVIPAGAGGVRRTGEYPVPIGTELWWSVVTDQGLTGWVNSRYLASTEPLPVDRLRALAERFDSNGTEAAPAAADLPLTRRADVAIGLPARPLEVPPETLLVADGWTEVRSFPLTADGADSLAASLDDLRPVDVGLTPTIDVEAEFTSASDQAAAERYFGDLPSVVIAGSGSDGIATRTFLFAESTPDGPEVVGILIDAAQS